MKREKKGKYLDTSKNRVGREIPWKKKTKRKKSKALRIVPVTLAVVVGICAIALGGYAIHLSKARSDFRELSDMVQTADQEPAARPVSAEPQETQDNTQETHEVQQTEAIQPTEPPQMLEQYVPLYEQNPDFYGWLRIDGTAIDYPVMYSPDEPEKYLHANFNGEYSYSDTPFVDASCDMDSDNTIIYAHNMLDGSMFRSLMKYQEKSYWEKHPTITFHTLYEEKEYEVLAAFPDRVYYTSETCFKFYKFINAADEADYDNAIANYREKQLYDTGVTASYGDKLITLVTCAYHTENGRFVVVAREK